MQNSKKKTQENPQGMIDLMGTELYKVTEYSQTAWCEFGVLAGDAGKSTWSGFMIFFAVLLFR